MADDLIRCGLINKVRRMPDRREASFILIDTQSLMYNKH